MYASMEENLFAFESQFDRNIFCVGYFGCKRKEKRISTNVLATFFFLMQKEPLLFGILFLVGMSYLDFLQEFTSVVQPKKVLNSFPKNGKIFKFSVFS